MNKINTGGDYMSNHNKNQTNEAKKGNPAWDQHNKGNDKKVEKQNNTVCGCGCGCDEE
jgi:hypothetical protein